VTTSVMNSGRLIDQFAQGKDMQQDSSCQCCNATGVRDPGRLRVIFSLHSCVWFRGIPVVTAKAYCEDGPIPDSGRG